MKSSEGDRQIKTTAMVFLLLGCLLGGGCAGLHGSDCFSAKDIAGLWVDANQDPDRDYYMGFTEEGDTFAFFTMKDGGEDTAFLKMSKGIYRGRYKIVSKGARSWIALTLDEKKGY